MPEALSRTTHLAISAHQDDIEIMASDGILKCFQQQDRWFTGVVVTDGAGSPRDDLYRDYTDEQMKAVRRKEQKKAAYVGEYGGIVLLDYPSSAVKSAAEAARARGPRRGAAGDAARGRLHPQPRRQARHPRGGDAADDRGDPLAAAGRAAEAALRLRGLARPRLADRRRQGGVRPLGAREPAGLARRRSSTRRSAAGSATTSPRRAAAARTPPTPRRTAPTPRRR